MLVLSLLCCIIWLYLWRGHGRFWQPCFLPPAAAPLHWPSVTIIVPARNEADILPHSLPSLLAQDYPGAWRIIVVDDNSDDGTATTVRKLAADTSKCAVLAHSGPPAGWTGKVAAMQAGLAASASDYILFTDADIAHPPQQLRRLVGAAIDWSAPLVSLMAKLHCRTVAERWCIPAFIYFFQLLYPFRRIQDDRAALGGAAGGVMLVARAALDAAGGLEKIKNRLIDDCALAQLLKKQVRDERRTVVLANTHDTHSLRVYHGWGDIMRMIARTAYEQLHYAPFLLAGCVAGLVLVFIWPLAMLLAGDFSSGLLGLAALLVMMRSYAPTVRFYDLPVWWVCTLPLVTLFYLAATLRSAFLHYRGQGGSWKGRTHQQQGNAA